MDIKTWYLKKRLNFIFRKMLRCAKTRKSYIADFPYRGFGKTTTILKLFFVSKLYGTGVILTKTECHKRLLIDKCSKEFKCPVDVLTAHSLDSLHGIRYNFIFVDGEFTDEDILEIHKRVHVPVIGFR